MKPVGLRVVTLKTRLTFGEREHDDIGHNSPPTGGELVP